MNALIPDIMKNVTMAREGNISSKEIFCAKDRPSGKHEFLFFIKPEITHPTSPVKTEAVLELMLTKIEQAGLSISNIRILGAGYLEKYNIIAQHYGVINRLAADPERFLSDSAKSTFSSAFGSDVGSVSLLGGIQFLERYPVFNPHSLDILWQNITFKKLAGGTYCGPVKIDGNTTYLVNGFHPEQLIYFTEEKRSIIVFTLVGDMSWADARSGFLGATDPAKALPGSIRRILLDKKEEYGLSLVAPSCNGAHMSAGPVEGLVELIRYNSDFAEGKAIGIEAFSFGRALAARFSQKSIDKILANENLSVNGKAVSVFDLTEEKNADEAIELLAGAEL